MEKRRSVGRPRQEPEPGERVQLSFRVTPELKRRLDAAATKSGRSQSQEAEFRLEQSFDREEISAGFKALEGVVRGLVVQMREKDETHRARLEQVLRAYDAIARYQGGGEKAARRKKAGEE